MYICLSPLHYMLYLMFIVIIYGRSRYGSGSAGVVGAGAGGAGVCTGGDVAGGAGCADSVGVKDKDKETSFTLEWYRI